MSVKDAPRQAPQDTAPPLVHAYRPGHNIRAGSVALCGYRLPEDRPAKTAADLSCVVCAHHLGWGLCG